MISNIVRNVIRNVNRLILTKLNERDKSLHISFFEEIC